MQKRTALKLALAGAFSMMLSACGKEEAKAPAAEPKKDAADATTNAADAPLKVAFIYVSPAN